MKVYVINGVGGSGKDTFVNFCRDYLGDNKVVNISTIDPIKGIARMCGWNGTKYERDRRFLSDLKDLLTEYNDYPFTWLQQEVKYYQGRDWIAEDAFYFIHCREPEEIQRLKDKYNATTILVRRPGISIESNHADSNVENFNYDIIVTNNGTVEDLRETSRIFCDKEKERS